MKTILIIGGSKGVGKALVDSLKNTNKIINFSRGNIEEHPNIKHYSLDVLNDTLPDIDVIDGLVYCPGSINLKPISRLSLDDFRNDFEINVVAAIRVIQKYIKSLKSSNASVVLFSTVATKLGMPFHTSVSASKSAVEGIVKSLAAEFVTKIRFNCIAPTVTNTDLASRLLRTERQQENIKEKHPLKKYLEPTDVANLATFLLSKDASVITGQVFPIDAGIVTLKI